MAKEGRELDPKDRSFVKAITAIGIGGAVGVLLLSVIMEGGNPMAFINIPSFLVVFGGTLAATLASTRASMLGTAVKTAKLALTGREIDHADGSKEMVKLAEKARKEGLLALENDLAEEFTNMIEAQRGFQANGRIISTADQMLQDLVNLGRG